MLFDFFKFIGLHAGMSFVALKITNTQHIGKLKTSIVIITSLLVALLQSVIVMPMTFKLILIILLYTIFFNRILNIAFENSFMVSVVSITLSMITITVSTLICVTIYSKLTNIHYTNPSITFFISLLSLTLLYLLSKLKRLKNGLPFLTKQYDNIHLSVFILVINVVIIFTYFLLGSFTKISIEELFWGFIMFSFVLFIIIQKTLILYQKQKIQIKALKDYEQELQQTKQKLNTALEEKQKLIQSNHEFYHRQEALNKKLDDLLKLQSLNMNTEFGEDYGNLLNRINNLSDEYTHKIQTIPSIPKTNIIELDDMLSYLQSECISNNIEFNLKIDYELDYIIGKYISKSQLETLLGDLVRNAIIAINHCTSNYRSIMCIFGIKDSSYELCVYDSGIPFEIDTLINLGLKPASTHESEGGTGIGFITTFEMLNSCKASLIINEITNNNYSKVLEIKFDNKNEYVIISERADEIISSNVDGRSIVVKKQY